MSEKIVHYKIKDAIATITMDDGKLNVISPQLLKELNNALDKAEQAGAIVILTGREGVFSSGFDLKILKTKVLDALNMLIGGFVLSHRLLSFPTPVIIACNGHAIAMGAFLLLSGDYRIGTINQTEDYKIATNEVGIGLVMPTSGIEICRQRLNPAHFVRATLLAEFYNPKTAIEAGFLDKVVEAQKLVSEANQKAQQLLKIDQDAHYQTKLRARHKMLFALKKAINWDRRNFVIKGSQRMIGQLLKK